MLSGSLTASLLGGNGSWSQIKAYSKQGTQPAPGRPAPRVATPLMGEMLAWEREGPVARKQ